MTQLYILKQDGNQPVMKSKGTTLHRWTMRISTMSSQEIQNSIYQIMLCKGPQRHSGNWMISFQGIKGRQIGYPMSQIK
jgi:hypothetical protein